MYMSPRAGCGPSRAAWLALIATLFFAGCANPSDAGSSDSGCAGGDCAGGCKSDSDCASASDGGDDGGAARLRCDPSSHRCVACLADADCPAAEVCRAGACRAGCSETRACDKSLACCDGACADTTSDPQHCGACGHACTTGWSCCDSTCVDSGSDVLHCGGCGVACMVAHGTPLCMSRACAVASCDPGWADCNGAAKDGCEMHTDVNLANCGGCGNFCSLPHALPRCAAGACAIDTCIPPWQDCNQTAGDGCETRVDNDLANCGSCGHACMLAHATAACEGGGCKVASCEMGFADCDMNPADGCEVNVTSDLRNCGGCGAVCAGENAVPACMNGHCMLACKQGFADCNKNAADGCEANLTSDVMNCLACGNACSLPHATPACVSSTCQIANCDVGFADCNANATDGCETSVFTEVANCGGCKNVCSNNHIANPACAMGQCSGACDAGFSDCNNNKQLDGCEVHTAADVANCGACGMVCAQVANGTPGCNSGVCGVGSCNGHFADCDKSAANGCEVNLDSDPKNCGSCGNACGANQTCTAGACAQLATNACAFQEAEHPAYTTQKQDVALCGNTYSQNDIRTACATGWHVCLLTEWSARFPAGQPPGGSLTTWGASQANRCPGNVWEAGRPVHMNPLLWSGNVCNSAYNPWNQGKYLFANDNTTILKGNGSCCGWDSGFSPTGDTQGFAVYCCR